MSELVALAERFVRLSGELDATRDAMKRLLLNGAGATSRTPLSPNPLGRSRRVEAETPARDCSSGGGGRSSKSCARRPA